MEILSQLFGGIARVKIMRLFIFNSDKFFSTDDIASKTRLTKTTIRKELRALEKIGMINKKEIPKTTDKGNKKTKVKKSRGREREYTLNPRFVYADALKQLLSFNDPIGHKEIADKLKKTGKLKLVLLTGVFIGQPTERVDILIVGDNLKKKDIDRALQMLESDIGREISYAYFDTDDFLYRVSVKDKLIRDLLDFPHERIVDKIDL